MLILISIILCLCIKSEILSLLCIIGGLVVFLYRIAENAPHNGI